MVYADSALPLALASRLNHDSSLSALQLQLLSIAFLLNSIKSAIRNVHPVPLAMSVACCVSELKNFGSVRAPWGRYNLPCRRLPVAVAVQSGRGPPCRLVTRVHRI